MASNVNTLTPAVDNLPRNARLEQIRTRSSSANGHRIVSILPRGEAIRNFVYTGALDELSRHAEVTVLSVRPSSEVWDILTDRYQDVLPLGEVPNHKVVGLLRELLDTAHGRWLWSEAAKERWRLRDQEARTGSQKARRAIKKAASYPFSNRPGLKVLSKVERASSRLLRTTDEYVKLFEEIKPGLVFNGSHVHGEVALQAVEAAQWLRIPTAAFIFSWDNLTSQGRIIPAYDYYLVWNEAIRDQLLEIYDSVRPDQIYITGSPQFDFHFRSEFHWGREKFCAMVGADPGRPIVLYTTGMANHMPGEPEIVASLARMLRQMDDVGRPQLLLRVYPKDRTGRFNSLKSEFPEILMPEIPWDEEWHTPKIEDAYLLTNTLRHADVGINVASTISLELCMFDKPVINVGFNPPTVASAVVDYGLYYNFDHYRPVVESGAVAVAYSEAELQAMLKVALSEPNKRSSQRKALVRDIFKSNLDGWSSVRVASVLDIILSKRLSEEEFQRSAEASVQ